ncbi:MAG: alpha/beta hydrolase [Betaproteobacteria bacterium]|nr:alpha/beta hydrolase [Betaproteobacteria bacterium]
MKHFAADDGESIRVEIAGTGTPLVLLHGWTASHQEWSPLVAALARHHQVIRWDAPRAPAATRSPRPRPRCGGWRRTCATCSITTRCATWVLVGHSMGALTIWEYLRAFGTTGVRKLCLIDQSPRLVTDGDWALGIYGDFDRDRAEAFAGELRADFTETVLRLAAHRKLNTRARSKYDDEREGLAAGAETLQRLDPAPLIDIWSSLTAADYRDVLERIGADAARLGRGQQLLRPGDRAGVHEHIRGSTLHVYEDTDHSPHQWRRERSNATCCRSSPADAGCGAGVDRGQRRLQRRP